MNENGSRGFDPELQAALKTALAHLHQVSQNIEAMMVQACGFEHVAAEVRLVRVGTTANTVKYQPEDLADLRNKTIYIDKDTAAELGLGRQIRLWIEPLS
jgi:hypothetical protein